MRDMAILGIEQIFTSHVGSADNPKGNTDTERVLQMIKELI